MEVNLPSYREKLSQNTVYALLMLGLYLGLYFFLRNVFFVSLFIVMNFIILNINNIFNLKSPIEIITFATVMCSYIYGPFEALIIVFSSWISIFYSGRISIRIIFSNLLLTGMAFLIPYFSFVNIAILGVSALALRYIIQFSFESTMVSKAKAMEQIPRRTINLIFWAVIYFSFGELILSLM